jgi:hypothetical protein
MDPLLSEVIEAHGGLRHWSEITRFTASMSIGGPIWATKGWPGALAHETVQIDTTRERSILTPFTDPACRMVFDGDGEKVAVEDTAGNPVEQRADARAAFKGHIRATPWDRMHLGYFIGYALWNYLTTPFLFTCPGVQAREIDPWQESGQTWRRLHVSFPASIVTHNPEQVFYYDHAGRQRRMDYVTEILGASLVAHYTSGYKNFGGIWFPTRRRVFRRNPDGTANLNMPSITIDISGITLE